MVPATTSKQHGEVQASLDHWCRKTVASTRNQHTYGLFVAGILVPSRRLLDECESGDPRGVSESFRLALRSGVAVGLGSPHSDGRIESAPDVEAPAPGQLYELAER